MTSSIPGSDGADSGSNKLEPSDWEVFPADSESAVSGHKLTATPVNRGGVRLWHYECLLCGAESDKFAPVLPCPGA